MVDNSKAKRKAQLGMDPGTAQNRLRKTLLFTMAQKLGLDTCYRCGKLITQESEFSIEHKEPWLDSEDPIDRFFNLDNIAFSHLKCNVEAKRVPRKYSSPEEKLLARRRQNKESERRRYTTEKRKQKYLRTGH